MSRIEYREVEFENGVKLTQKTCTECGEWQNLSGFPIRRETGRPRAKCRNCVQLERRTKAKGTYVPIVKYWWIIEKLHEGRTSREVARLLRVTPSTLSSWRAIARQADRPKYTRRRWRMKKSVVQRAIYLLHQEAKEKEAA